MNKAPSLVKMITVDFAAFVAFVIPLACWGIYIFLLVTQKIEASNLTLPVIFGLITLPALAVLVWRIRTIQGIFENAPDTPAVISSVAFFRDRGRIEYIYTYQGQKYIGANAVMKVKQTQALQVGDAVMVVVDQAQPKRAFIRKLYL